MRRRPSVVARVFVSAAVLVAIAGACSVTERLDREGLEADVRAQLFAEHPGLVEAVTCPEFDDPAPGRSFVCAAQIGEQIIDVPVTLTGDPDALEALVDLDDRFVAVGSVAEMLAEAFEDDLGLVTAVDCGQPILVLDADETLLCTATDPRGVARLFDVSIDDDGTLRLRLR